jgi:hypothetical protein
MLYSTKEESIFWRFVTRINAGTWILLARKNRELNNVALRRFPRDVWDLIFGYVFSWDLPSMCWAHVCGSCQQWNLRGHLWKEVNKNPHTTTTGHDYFQFSCIPEERRLGMFHYPLIGELPQDRCESLHVMLLKYRSKIIHADASRPPDVTDNWSSASYLDELKEYKKWWKKWGTGPIINRNLAVYIWRTDRGIVENEPPCPFKNRGNVPRMIFQCNQHRPKG